MRILSMDPGTSNYAASILEVRAKSGVLHYRVLAKGFVENTIVNPQKICDQGHAFQREIRGIEKRFGPFDLVVAERYQSRGMGGTTIESVNMMLGILSVMYRDTMTIYTAATWKNKVNKFFDLKQLYLDRKELMVPVRPITDRLTDHETDCTLMGMYHAGQVLGVEPYSRFSDADYRATFLKYLHSRPKV